MEKNPYIPSEKLRIRMKLTMKISWYAIMVWAWQAKQLVTISKINLFRKMTQKLQLSTTQ